ncbi:MAG TPA: pyridoxal 5'-phosphate synthase glutaminase subunit PdxT [Candidatus Hodarchaeales archaeon]|nr:pyridoxal 5'-phosphate synthase glutaminase subunit PdxT [Candidatus Hodarchaeales archaeon]
MVKTETIGILSLQGDFLEHEMMIQAINPDYNIIHLNHPDQIPEVDRLVLPGGESTTMNRLGGHAIGNTRFFEALKKHLTSRPIPILATCAGMILISQDIQSIPERKSLKPILGLLPIRVLRNNYGRQQLSFEAPLDVTGFDSSFNGVFIRAPVVELLPNTNVEVVAKYQGAPVLIRHKNIIASTFHPELTTDQRIHRMFLGMKN